MSSSHSRSEDGDSDAKASYCIVHSVVCNRDRVDGEDHSDHEGEASYLDVPRLYADDTRASALRGQDDIEDPRVYRDDNPQIKILVLRTYNCNAYHRAYEDQFELIAPSLELSTPRKLRPWIYQLRTACPPAKVESERIIISNTLSVAMSKLANQYYPDIGRWDIAEHLKEPYNYFYHFRKLIRMKLISQLATRDCEELTVLLDYLDETKGDEFYEADRAFSSGIVRYNLFGKLFTSNELVATTQNSLARALFAEKVTINDSNEDSSQSISLECWSWTFDGSFRKKLETLVIKWPRSKEVSISLDKLSAYPLRLDKSGLRESLLKRGRNFWGCRGRKLVCYNAPTPTIFEMQVTNPKYMIDYQTYRQMHPSRDVQPLLSNAEMMEQGVDMNTNEPPNDLFCILLPPTLQGYAFHDKKWRTLSMDHVGPVPWNKDAFSQLVLKPNKKETIKALVTVHLKSTQDVDVVDNKGNGLIILLHGPPGTGKTLTAESVAEIAEKPLYRVTCGDVGTDAESVERYMESVLLIGTIWECVVLLDEADVFLEERQVTDLARNALVSVFLRILEYYDGILILTTNRVGSFDEAFKSRIQLAIHYPVLDESDRLQIWLNFINALHDKKVDMEFAELKRKADYLARIPFNGRQIRNILWTAAQVAKYKNESLDYSKLEQVVEISQEFEEYLSRTHGVTDEEKARMDRMRT